MRVPRSSSGLAIVHRHQQRLGLRNPGKLRRRLRRSLHRPGTSCRDAATSRFVPGRRANAHRQRYRPVRARIQWSSDHPAFAQFLGEDIAAALNALTNSINNNVNVIGTGESGSYDLVFGGSLAGQGSLVPTLTTVNFGATAIATQANAPARTCSSSRSPAIREPSR